MNQARDIEYKYLIKSKNGKMQWEDKEATNAVNEGFNQSSNRRVDVSHYFDHRKFNHVVIEDMGFNKF